MIRALAFLLTILFVAFAVQRSRAQQIMLGAGVGQQPDFTASATPTPTPTPPPGVPLAAPTSIAYAISHNPAGTTFDLACGTYRFDDAANSINDFALNPLTGDKLIGQNADLSYPGAPSTTIPSSEPCAKLNGSILVTNWTSISTPTNLWYHTVGLSKVDNVAADIMGSCNTIVGSSTTGSSNSPSPFWTASTAYALNALVVDSNGNTQQAQSAFTSASSPPTWATTIGASTTDAAGAWKVLYNSTTPTSITGPCSYPQDLFVNNVFRNRVLTWPPSANANQWYLDVTGNQGHGAGTIYLADNPATSCGGACTIELETVRQAVASFNDNITIQNLGIEKFATNIQRGMIESNAQNWLVNATWITHGHAEGLKPRNSGTHNVVNMTISYNEVLENGQSGINTGAGVGYIINGNDSTRNNEAGVGYGFEGGGSKFAADFGDLITNNVFAYNNNCGLWEDSNGGGPGTQQNIWQNNTVTGNVKDGIRYEISNYGVIQDNVTLNNGERNHLQCVAAHVPLLLAGVDCCTGPQTGPSCDTGTVCVSTGYYEIVSAQSNHMTIGGIGHGNTSTGHCGGFNISSGTRSASATTNVQFTYNTLTLHTGSAVVPYQIGGIYGTGSASGGVFGAGNNNGYDHNTYHFDNSTSLAAPNFQWDDGTHTGQTSYSFTNWNASPQLQDVNGSAVTP